MKLKDFLKDVLELGRDDVFKVEVKDSFSFFNTEKENQEKVLAFFTDYKHDGRYVNVEISENRGGGRRNSGGRHDKPKGIRSRDDRRSKSGSGNRSDRRSSNGSYSKSGRSDSGSLQSRPRRSRR